MTDEHKPIPGSRLIGKGLTIEPHPFQVLLRMVADAYDASAAQWRTKSDPSVEIRFVYRMHAQTMQDVAAALRAKAGGGEWPTTNLLLPGRWPKPPRCAPE